MIRKKNLIWCLVQSECSKNVDFPITILKQNKHDRYKLLLYTQRQEMTHLFIL